MTKPQLLLADDNEKILDFLEHELLKEHFVELLIFDVGMPVMDGFELCRIIKTDLEYSHIPVILLTAKNTMQSKIEGLELGADAYIEKPFSPEYLKVQIANLLTNRNKIKEYFASSPLVHIKSMAYSRADEQFLEQINDVI